VPDAAALPAAKARSRERLAALRDAVMALLG